MNFDPETFKVLVEYPNKQKIREQVESEVSTGKMTFLGKDLVNTKPLIDSIVNERAFNMHIKYKSAEAEANQAFRAHLEKEYIGDSLSEGAKSAIWWKSWEDGHAGGYGDVENQYRDNVEFANKLLS